LETYRQAQQHQAALVSRLQAKVMFLIVNDFMKLNHYVTSDFRVYLEKRLLICTLLSHYVLFHGHSSSHTNALFWLCLVRFN
jgi:hypothetical protein